MRLTEQRAAVLRYCELWGVETRLGRPSYSYPSYRYMDGTYDPAIEGPDRELLNGNDTWICWTSRTIYYDKFVSPNFLLHELGHVVIGTYPQTTNDTRSGILYFEHCSARGLGLSDVLLNRDVARDLNTWRTRLWQDLSPRRQRSLLAQSRARCVNLGLFTDKGLPTFRRLPRSLPITMKGRQP